MATLFIPEPDVLALEGEIDLHEAPRLREEVRKVLDKHPHTLYVDFSGVTFIDSSGLAVLIEAMQRINADGGQLALFGIHDAVETIFHIARLDQVFRIYPDIQAARKQT
ncbi:MAG: STAS domain-containing protein [Chthoniobacteraceae bacterium]